jgi:hypothetical protein
MNSTPNESDARGFRKAIPLPDGVTLNGNQKTVFDWLSVHPGWFHAVTISNSAAVSTSTARGALNDLVRRGIVQIKQWNDEHYDPLYSLVAVE